MNPVNENNIEPRNLQSGTGYGLRGGTIMDYPNLVWLGDDSYNFVQDILDELNLGLDPDVDMIHPVTPMWSILRAQYAEDYRDLERMDLYDRGLPTITHVDIFKVSSYNQITYKPHDTGIFVKKKKKKKKKKI